MCCTAPACGRAEPIWLGVMCGWDTCAGRAMGAATRADGMCELCVMLGTEMRGDDTWGITTRGTIRGAEKCGGEIWGARRGAEKRGAEKCGAANARIPPPPPKCPPPPGRATAALIVHAVQMSRMGVIRATDCVMARTPMPPQSLYRKWPALIAYARTILRSVLRHRSFADEIDPAISHDADTNLTPFPLRPCSRRQPRRLLSSAATSSVGGTVRLSIRRSWRCGRGTDLNVLLAIEDFLPMYEMVHQSA